MQLGFVSAIVPDLSLEEVLSFAAATGYDCVELMCWPRGKADRRYAGVTHIDVSSLDQAGLEKVQSQVEAAGVAISGLGIIQMRSRRMPKKRRLRYRICGR